MPVQESIDWTYEFLVRPSSVVGPGSYQEPCPVETIDKDKMSGQQLVVVEAREDFGMPDKSTPFIVLERLSIPLPKDMGVNQLQNVICRDASCCLTSHPIGSAYLAAREPIKLSPQLILGAR